MKGKIFAAAFVQVMQKNLTVVIKYKPCLIYVVLGIIINLKIRYI